jgi:hypothetical protein
MEAFAVELRHALLGLHRDAADPLRCAAEKQSANQPRSWLFVREANVPRSDGAHGNLSERTREHGVIKAA